jgi:hypothetical protein
MKIHMNRGDEFYMKYLLILACFFGSLLIDPAALAQQQEYLDIAIAPDNRYGEGGTVVTRVLPSNPGPAWVLWKDKEGVTREMEIYQYHEYDDAQKLLLPEEEGFMSRSWVFYRVYNGESVPVETFYWSGETKEFVMGDYYEGVVRPGTDKQTASSLIQKIEKQFAKDGTIPIDPLGKLTELGGVVTGKEGSIKKVLDNLLQKLDEAVESCNQLKAKIKAAQDELAKLEDRIQKEDWPRWVRYYDRELENARKIAREAEKDGNEARRGVELDLAHEFIQSRENCNKLISDSSLQKEKIRKKIDELLSQLADCPKQEPIDAQFDCLKAKFPGIQRSPDKKDAASDPTSQRNFAWDDSKQAWIDDATKESICPPSGIDACLIGTWECTNFKPDTPGFTGGTGFRVTFKSDGTETVDYSSMQPTRAGSRDMDKFIGIASAKISTDKGVAKIEEGKQTADLGLSLVQIFIRERAKCPGLGPGALGSSKDNNSYKCTGDSLEYHTTWLGVVYGGHHRNSYTVKLRKVKP